jgi:hypothetical protein
MGNNQFFEIIFFFRAVGARDSETLWVPKRGGLSWSFKTAKRNASYSTHIRHRVDFIWGKNYSYEIHCIYLKFYFKLCRLLKVNCRVRRTHLA